MATPMDIESLGLNDKRNPIHKVFRNKFLVAEIQKHINIYNQVNKDYKRTIIQLENEKNRIYIQRLKLIEDNPPTKNIVKEIPKDLIPSEVETLILKSNIRIGEGHFKEGIKSLEFCYQIKEINIDHLPASIRKLRISKDTRIIIPSKFKIFNHLDELTIDRQSSSLLNHLDNFPKLKLLTIGGFLGPADEFIIPSNIKEIVFSCNYNKSSLPNIHENVISLDIGAMVKKVTLSSLPSGLRLLFINSKFIKFNLNDFSIFPNLILLDYYSNDYSPDVSNVLKILPNLIHLYINGVEYETINGEMIMINKKRKIMQLNCQ